MIPIPFIVVYIRRIFQWMRRRIPRLGQLVDRLEKKAHLKGRKVTKYKYLGLFIFVAIPLPGTGGWTGALVAAFLNMPLLQGIALHFCRGRHRWTYHDVFDPHGDDTCDVTPAPRIEWRGGEPGI